MTDKSNVGDLCDGILFSFAKEGNSDPGHHVDGPEGMTLSAVCQSQKDKGCVTLLTGVPSVAKHLETESRSEVVRGCGEGREGSWC